MQRSCKKILTILISCYNAERYLRECLDSLVRQSEYGLFCRIMLVNDASTDNSYELAMSYIPRMKSLTILNNQRNIGLTESCNKALEIINTDYFMRLDADDYLSDDALEKIELELNCPDRGDFIVFKRYDICENAKEKIELGNNIYTWISAGTVFNTETVRSVGGYSKEYWEEYDLYIKLLERGSRFKISPYYVYCYRRGHNSMTRNFAQNEKGYKSLLNKWGEPILGKYGDIRQFLKYYMTKEQIECRKQ